MPPYQYAFPPRRLVSQDDAAIVQRAQVPRAKFINEWTLKTAFNAGLLVPIWWDEILPGDHVVYDISAYVRMETPLFPIFDTQRVDTFAFFIPTRLVWTNFVKQMGEQVNPTDSIAFTTPQVTSPADGYLVGSLADYLGLPTKGQTGVGATISTISLPMRAYNKVWNAWFRDENLQNSVADNMGDGPDAASDYTVLERNKPHDYFTSALPWPQKFTAPATPLSGTAPVGGIGFVSPGGTPIVAAVSVHDATGLGTYASAGHTDSANSIYVKAKDTDTSTPDLWADLSAATGVTINVFRQAFMIQELLERDARGGTRYTELIKSHFGVTNPDFRLQRPEYIGGGQTPLIITPIAQTAPTTGVPLGALGGAGTAAGRHHASYAATEHGIILWMINVRTEISYQQGIPRKWFRNTRYDHYFPAFAGLGEQAILKREIYSDGSGTDADVFGYQERWHEYRNNYSLVTGILRSTATNTLDPWHLAQRFSAVPSLNSTFIKDTPPVSRVIAAGTTATDRKQEYKANVAFHRTIVRTVPAFGTPVTLGRF